MAAALSPHLVEQATTAPFVAVSGLPAFNDSRRLMGDDIATETQICPARTEAEAQPLPGRSPC